MGLVSPWPRFAVNAGLADYMVAPSIFYDNLRLGKTGRTGPTNRERAVSKIRKFIAAINKPSRRLPDKFDTSKVSHELELYAQELEQNQPIDPERCAQIRDRLIGLGYEVTF